MSSYGGDLILMVGGSEGPTVMGMGKPMYFARENREADIDHIVNDGRSVCNNICMPIPSLKGSTYISKALVEENTALCPECREVWENYVHTRKIMEE